jgi:hypothetical protein
MAHNAKSEKIGKQCLNWIDLKPRVTVAEQTEEII